MRKKLIIIILMWLVVMTGWSSSLSAPAQAQEKKAARPAPALKVGDAAPDFKLQYFDGTDLKNVSLGDYRGKKNVVLAFYVFAFTGG
jgi:cytochrome oxidase Cu insertion factor (SCO1/SenC/PrrC family)